MPFDGLRAVRMVERLRADRAGLRFAPKGSNDKQGVGVTPGDACPPPFVIRTRHWRVNFGFDSPFGPRTRHRRVNFVIPPQSPSALSAISLAAVKPRRACPARGLRPPWPGCGSGRGPLPPATARLVAVPGWPAAVSAVKAAQVPCQRRGKKVINIKVCTWHGWKKCEIGHKNR